LGLQLAVAKTGGLGGAAGGVVEGALVLEPLLRQALVELLGLGLLDLADEVVDGKGRLLGLAGRHAERSRTGFQCRHHR
jgi:hypothetical protein